jgi:hypothetical protein
MTIEQSYHALLEEIDAVQTTLRRLLGHADALVQLIAAGHGDLVLEAPANGHQEVPEALAGADGPLPMSSPRVAPRPRSSPASARS